MKTAAILIEFCAKHNNLSSSQHANSQMIECEVSCLRKAASINVFSITSRETLTPILSPRNCIDRGIFLEADWVTLTGVLTVDVDVVIGWFSCHFQQSP